MNAVQLALPIIKNYEGFRSKAYLCPVGKPTIGYGSTGPDIRLGLVWTQNKALERLHADVARFSKEIDALVKVPLTENQRGALISFVYNIGTTRFSTSTLLRRLNAGDYAAVGPQFLRWVYGEGRVLPGLKARRLAEKALWETAE